MARSVLGKRTRQFLVFLHVVVSLGWMGAGAANVVLSMTAWLTDDPVVARVCYQMTWSMEEYLIIPGAFSALGTGVLLSLLTPWGLAKYWWVLVKLVLTVGIIVYSTLYIGVWSIESIEATTAGSPVSPVATHLALGPLPSLAAFLLMTWASVAKPWGKTPWFRRTSVSRGAGRRTRAAAARPVPTGTGVATPVVEKPRSGQAAGEEAEPAEPAEPVGAGAAEERGAAMA
ncbi:hypothetical protein [Actinomycetospora termitidis]|uniref:DUF2269 domain-containing protein n=1 Tax=Actinomycetospora termitidis TaxID=3053470 RepID=A0ABT7MF43_9PSEU|nr:hypothetical protein [Actinomycetospora sp. Odt1-22]MDL5158607.1 hypothetical protein [Actinomycetospora sp. Odt1-22]